MCKIEISRKWVKTNKEDILDMIQHLANVVRYADRPEENTNSDFYKSYFKMAASCWSRIIDNTKYDN